MTITASKLAHELNTETIGPDLDISGVTSYHYPEKNKIIPFLHIKNIEIIKSALTVGNCFLTNKTIYTQIKSDYPNNHTWIVTPTKEIKSTFIALLNRFDIYHTPKPVVTVETTSGQISEKSKHAIADIGSHIAEDVFVGPQVVIGENTRIESGTIMLGQNYIGYGVTLGRNTLIHPQVTIHNGTVIGDHCIIHSGTVLGSDGFGYESSHLGLQKIPQIGNVAIGKSVEIGSNCSIDRATLNSTRIGDRVKIDNLVQIGHNVIIGDDTIIVSQCGIAGSSRIGKGVILGGQVGIADYVVIGDGVKVVSKSGIYAGKKIPNGAILRGIPAIDHIQQTRIDVSMRKLIKKK